MATSGDYNYNRNALQIITEALELIGSYESGESIDPNDVSSCLKTLNMMVKSWQADGIGLWKNVDAALFLEYDENEYLIGPTGDHATASWIKTEVATAAASAATSLVVDSTTGATDTFDRNGIITAVTPSGAGSITLDGTLVTSAIAYLPSQREILIYSDGDDSGVTFSITGTDNNDASVTETITGPKTTTVYSAETYKTISNVAISGAGTGNIEVGCVGNHVGIELDDDTLQWTWIGAALSTTLTLVDALTDDVAVDNHVYIYEDKLPRPLEIADAMLMQASGYERPLSIKTKDEYRRLTNKTERGSVNTVYFDPRRGNAQMSIWQSCNDIQEYITFTARIPIEDFDANTDDPDFPQGWLLTLAWNLAVLIAPKFGAVLTPIFELKASNMLQRLSDFDREYGSVYFSTRTR
jgi:hypothetical protein